MTTPKIKTFCEPRDSYTVHNDVKGLDSAFRFCGGFSQQGTCVEDPGDLERDRKGSRKALHLNKLPDNHAVHCHGGTRQQIGSRI